MKMKRIGSIIWMLTVVMTLSAQQAGNKKLSAWVRDVIQERKPTPSPSRRDGKPTPSPSRREESLITTFIRTTDAMTEEKLSEYGCKVYARLGDISIVTVPVSQLEALSQLPEVKRIEASPSAQLTMDTVPQVIKALPAYQQTPQHGAFTGKGVVMGVMDVGFDLTHPTFFNDPTLSNYRIKAFWDQLAPSTDDDRFPVGREYATTEELLEKGCATDSKTQNHGTHTSGIAAGSGYDMPYRGIAYESDIVLVANAVTSDTIYIDPKDYQKYTSATDALGFKYLFDYAEQQGKPCVVSFSEGYMPYMDEDDELYSEFLERLTGPGRILVASAGNEGLNYTYLPKPFGAEESGSFLNSSKKQALYRLLSDGTPTLHLMAYDRQTHQQTHQLTIALNSTAWEEDTLKDTLFIYNPANDAEKDYCAVSITRHTSSLIEGKTMYLMRLNGTKNIASLPYLALVLEGTDCEAEVFGTSSYAFVNLPDIDARWQMAEKGHNVLAPGGLKAPICVGSTTHRMSFTNASGETIGMFYEGDVAGQWSQFSSTGPTMGGLTKPEITAPGVFVISSLNSYYMEEHPTATGDYAGYSTVNGRTYPWGYSSGTSMSTPAVAGAIALWLQANPTLTRDDIIGVLERTSRHPEEQLTYPNNHYGYGEIDVYRGLLDVLGITGIPEISMHQSQGVRIYMQHGMLHLVFNELPTQPVTLTIYSTNGTLMQRQQLTVQQREVTVPLNGLATGIYVVQVTGERKVTGSEIVRVYSL